jgi:hypothetical protein
MLAQTMGVVETADRLVHEVLSRKLRDRRAVTRYGGLTAAYRMTTSMQSKEKHRDLLLSLA